MKKPAFLSIVQILKILETNAATLKKNLSLYAFFFPKNYSTIH